MSQENVEIVRRLYRAWAAGENVIRWHADRGEMFEDPRQEVDRLLDKGDKVLGFIRPTGRGRGSGAPFDIRMAHLLTVRDVLVVRGEGYGSRNEAHEAAGLSEQDAHADS